MRITQAAETLVPYLREVVSNESTARLVLEEWKGQKRGHIRIGSGPSASSHLLPPLLKQYHARFPLVDVYLECTVEPEALLAKVSGGALDLALLMYVSLPEQPNVVDHIAWQSPMVLVANREGVPARCKLSDLRQQPFILFQKNSMMDTLVSGYFASLAFRPRIIIRSDSGDAVLSLARQGLGIAILPLWCVEEDAQRGRLRILGQREKRLTISLALFGRKSAFLPPAVRGLVQLASTFPWVHLEAISTSKPPGALSFPSL